MSLAHAASLSRPQLLQAWEAGAHTAISEWPLRLLSIAYPDFLYETLEQMTISQRDQLVLGLRESVFGSSMRSRATCSRCDTPIELTFLTSDLQTNNGAASKTDLGQFTCAAGRHVATFRLPRCADWIRLDTDPARPAGDDHALSQLLARRCLVALDGQESNDERQPVPEDVLASVAKAIADSDVNTHTELRVECPQCGHHWTALFDVVSYFWEELDVHCQRLLEHVHLLAQAYGWTEDQILRLSDARRQAYLALIGHG